MTKGVLIPFNRAGRGEEPRPEGFDSFVEDEGLGLRHYWRAIMQYKWGILGLVVGASLFTLVWAYSLTPVYRSTATLMIGGGAESIAVSEVSDLQDKFDRGQFFNTQLELIKSREVALTVLDRLGPVADGIYAGLPKDTAPGFDWRAWVPPSLLEKLNLNPPDGVWPEEQMPDSALQDAGPLDGDVAEWSDPRAAEGTAVVGISEDELVEQASLAVDPEPQAAPETMAPPPPGEAETPTPHPVGTTAEFPTSAGAPATAALDEQAPEAVSVNAPDFLDTAEPAQSGDALSARDKRLLGWLSDNLSVQPVRNTSMVTVSFEASSPQLAARIANAFTEAFVEYNLRQRRESTTQASTWLRDQLEKANQHVLNSVDQLQEHREAAGLVDLGGLHSVQTEQLKEATAALSFAQRARNEAEGLYRRARELKAAGRLDALPSVRENSWIQELRGRAEELERQIRADEARYTDAYPALVDARDQLTAVRRQLNTALATLVDGFRTDYEIAVANEEKLQQEVAALEAGVRELDRRQLQAQALEQSVQTNRQYYDAFLEKLMETSTRQEDTVSMVAQVIDRAVPVFTPVKPNKMRMVMLGVVLSTMAGIGIALLLDMLDSTLKRREDVEDRLGIPVLGELMLLGKQRANGAEMRPAIEFVDEPTSAFAEDIRTIRTGVALSGMDRSAQVLVVTSTVSGEGKSTLALNLAMALGQLGTVLLIDADMRRPSVAKNLGLEERGPGLTDLVAGTVKVDDCVREFAPGGIDVLPAGSSLPPDPLKLLASERFERLLDHAAETYHAVVVDSAPVELVSDARMLATKATGVLYVIRADDTSYQAVRRGLSNLAETGAPLLGAVLNQIDPKAAKSYGYYKYGSGGYGRYGGRYGADVADAPTPGQAQDA